MGGGGSPPLSKFHQIIKVYMKMSVNVSIGIEDGYVKISNDRDIEWKILFKGILQDDDSVCTAVAAVASSMLTATIQSHLKHVADKSIEYKLTVLV